jgi:cytochrome bd-type quinol oxidase subunit 2
VQQSFALTTVVTGGFAIKSKEVIAIQTVKRSVRTKVTITVLVGIMLVCGWTTPFLPGRVSWAQYSFPASITRSPNGLVLVPIPSAAINGTTWRVNVTLGSSPGTDSYQLVVKRWLSSTTITSGESITIEGEKYTLADIARRSDGQWEVDLRQY